MHYFSILKFEKIFENGKNFFKENCEKFRTFAYYSKNLTNHAFLYWAFHEKRKLLGKSAVIWEKIACPFLGMLIDAVFPLSHLDIQAFPK